MNVGEICSKNIVHASPQDSVLNVARIMRERHVCSVVVVDKVNGEIRPQGIITDRDLVIEVLAAKIDPSILTAEDILTCELRCLTETHDVKEALEYMRYFGIKQAPVVNTNGILVGLFSIEDSLSKLSKEFSELMSLLSNNMNNESQKNGNV